MSDDTLAYSSFRIAAKYLRHYLGASHGKGHGTHSPFVYAFIRDLLMDRTVYPEYGRAEHIRRQMLSDKSLLEVEDFGAGPAAGAGRRRTVSSIARHSAKSPRLARLLFRMLRHYRPGSVIELGTSLGITTAYLALAVPETPVYTFEGSEAVADKALENFQQAGLKNVSLVRGNFDDQFAPFLSQRRRVDFLYVDGNHRREPTLRYFEAALPWVHNESVIVFDDVHWSSSMEQAWELVCNHPSVTCSIDLFWMGIVFFRREFYQKQHFRIRF